MNSHAASLLSLLIIQFLSGVGGILITILNNYYDLYFKHALEQKVSNWVLVF